MCEKDTIEIGIIGAGGMGRFYAKTFSKAGWKNVYVCDLPEKYEQLKKEFEGTDIKVVPDGYHISRRCDWIMYAVEAEYIDAVVKQYGPATKIGAIVGGQTSVKKPEVEAFEKYLPEDVHIICCHSMHGPGVDPKGQPLIIINHRGTQEKLDLSLHILSCFESKMTLLSADEHDKITADTQAVTHAAFLTMGSAWKANNQYPWLLPQFNGGIENVKINIAMRIYSNKWHVYAGLAIMNPIAKVQIAQYAKSVADLFKLLLQEREEEFRTRIKKAGEFVFGGLQQDHVPILLDDSILDKYSLSKIPKENKLPNSHLSLLAIVDSWHALGINPYEHMVCQTPIFRIWMGITEYLFRHPALLEDTIVSAFKRKETRPDDMEFVTCARGWAEAVALGNMEGYQKRFEETADFYRAQFAASTLIGNQMISSISKNATAASAN